MYPQGPTYIDWRWIKPLVGALVLQQRSCRAISDDCTLEWIAFSVYTSHSMGIRASVCGKLVGQASGDAIANDNVPKAKIFAWPERWDRIPSPIREWYCWHYLDEIWLNTWVSELDSTLVIQRKAVVSKMIMAWLSFHFSWRAAEVLLKFLLL